MAKLERARTMRALIVLVLMLTNLAWQARAAERRVALVVGVSAYQHAPALPNTRNDASDVAAALQRLGFSVDSVLDPDRAGLERAVRRLGDAARGAEAAVFFYAGHALEVGGRNWLLPASMELRSARDLRFEALDLDSVLEQTDGAARITLLFLDACRNNPFRQFLVSRARDLAREGLGPVSAAAGTLLAYGTAPGAVARDGAGRNSPFTAALLRHIETPGLEVRQMLSLVRRDVREASGGTQIPWENSSLEGDFYFRPGPPASAAGAQADLLFWQSIKDSGDPDLFRTYVARFPSGTFVDLARRRLSGAQAAAPAPAMPGPSAPPPASPPARAADPAFAARLVEAADHRAGDLAVSPWLHGNHQDIVAEYGRQPAQKALAAEPRSGRLYWWSGVSAAGLAEQMALEGCQQTYVEPCLVLATNGTLHAADPGGGPMRRMERLAYDGPFRVEQVPFTNPEQLPQAVRDYAAMPAPKALAARAIGPVFAARTGASPAEAQAAALAACNVGALPFPCFLYAADDRVLLPRRLTEAPR